MSARRDARAKRVKLCGACNGRGNTKAMMHDGGYQEKFIAFRWDAEKKEYVSYWVFVRRMGCWACNGSGLNCSQQRAAELEHENGLNAR